MSQDFSYRWEQAYEAHKASGLTIREFHRTRAAEFCDGSYLPTYVTTTGHFRRLRLRGVQAAGQGRSLHLFASRGRIAHFAQPPVKASLGNAVIAMSQRHGDLLGQDPTEYLILLF